MKAYWILFTLILIVQLCPVKRSTEKISNIKLILSLILLFIYGSIRVDYGYDYEEYKNIFDDIKQNSFFDNHYEYGYVLLNKIVPFFRFLIVLLSAFTCFAYYFLFKNYVPRKYYWIGFLLMSIFGDMMVFFQFSGLRNAVTVNIMMLSLPLLKNRKIIPYTGLIIIGYFFHNSILFFMPLVYFIATSNKPKKQHIVFWSIVFIVLLIVSVTSLIEWISPIIDTYFDRYSSYIANAYWEKHKSSILMYGFILLVFVLSCIILIKEKLQDNDIMIIKLSLLFLVSLILGALNLRMSQYFAPYLLVSTTIVMDRVKQPVLKYAYLVSVILFLFYSFFIVFIGNPDFPYTHFHTIFD